MITVLIGITNVLIQDSVKLNILVHEVRSAFRSEKDITGATVSRIQYLDALIKEGLRLCLTIPNGQ